MGSQEVVKVPEEGEAGGRVLEQEEVVRISPRLFLEEDDDDPGGSSFLRLRFLPCPTIIFSKGAVIDLVPVDGVCYGISREELEYERVSLNLVKEHKPMML